jgi:hypothetical protein
MGPTPVCSIEKRDVRYSMPRLVTLFRSVKCRSCVHWYQGKRQAEGHGHHAANEAIPMQLFPLFSQPCEHFRDILLVHDITWVDDIKLFALGDLFGLQLGIRRREALQSPFLVWDALQSLVTVVDQCLPPSFFGSLPLRPCLCCFPRYTIGDTWLDGGLFCSLLTEDQGLSRGKRKEEDFSHSSDGSRDKLKAKLHEAVPFREVSRKSCSKGHRCCDVEERESRARKGQVDLRGEAPVKFPAMTMTDDATGTGLQISHFAQKFPSITMRQCGHVHCAWKQRLWWPVPQRHGNFGDLDSPWQALEQHLRRSRATIRQAGLYSKGRCSFGLWGRAAGPPHQLNTR